MAQRESRKFDGDVNKLWSYARFKHFMASWYLLDIVERDQWVHIKPGEDILAMDLVHDDIEDCVHKLRKRVEHILGLTEEILYQYARMFIFVHNRLKYFEQVNGQNVEFDQIIRFVHRRASLGMKPQLETFQAELRSTREFLELAILQIFERLQNNRIGLEAETGRKIFADRVNDTWVFWNTEHEKTIGADMKFLERDTNRISTIVNEHFKWYSDIIFDIAEEAQAAEARTGSSDAAA